MPEVAESEPIEVFEGLWEMAEFYAEQDATLTVSVVERKDREFVLNTDYSRGVCTTQSNFDHGGEARILQCKLKDSALDADWGLEGEDETVVLRKRGFHRASPDAMHEEASQFKRDREVVTRLEVQR